MLATIFAMGIVRDMENTTRPALTLAHTSTAVPQEVAYRNLLAAIFEPTGYAPKRARTHLTSVK